MIMKISSFHHFILKLSFLAGISLFGLNAHAQEAAKGEAPTFKMSGDVALLTNFVEHGLTQTNKDPTLQGAFGFNFGPQFKLGLWGSNVNYESTEHFLLKLNAEIKILISAATDIKLGYYANQYFKTTSRDGNTSYFLLTSYGYRVRYESISNWEGQGESATYYALGKLIVLSPSWGWDNEVGYTMIENVTGIENYFDLRTSLQYHGGNNITYQLTATGTSVPTQFNGRGDIFVFLGASTSF